MSRQRQHLLDQGVAVTRYIDSLLGDEPAEKQQPGAIGPVDEAAEPANEAVPGGQGEIADPVAAEPAEAEIDAAESVDVAPEAPAAAEPAPEAGEGPAAVSPAPEPAPSAEPPEWAGEDFQALTVTVGETTLALPLARLQTVLPAEKIEAAAGGPGWLAGFLPRNGGRLPVADARRLGPAGGEARGAGHVLVGDEGMWGLTCDRVGEVVQVAVDEVDWQGGDWQWGAGLTADGQRILDPDQILTELAGLDGPA